MRAGRVVRKAVGGCIYLVFAVALVVHAASAPRSWHSGTLVSSEQTKELQGSTWNSNTDASAKKRGDKTDYSRNTTTTSTDNYDKFQVYTIETPHKVYVVREKLNFPWSKPANITVGEPVKYAVEKNKMYLMDDDGKEHKGSIAKVSMNASH